MLSLSVIKSYNGDNSHEYVKYWLLGMVYTHLVLLEVVIFMFICGIDRECDGGHLSMLNRLIIEAHVTFPLIYLTHVVT